MPEEIVNRVAKSKLKTFNLEDHYPQGKRVLFDLKDWLYEGFVLREKEFRKAVKEHDWSTYQGNYVALTCSSDAIVPVWAFMLVTTELKPYAKKVILGNLTDLESLIYQEIINQLDVSEFEDLPVIVKGCSNKPVPDNAYIQIVQKLQPVVKSLMFGEACSSVPLYKKPKK